jgi:hypothetical protein
MKKQKTQRDILFARLKRGWLNSLQAAVDCSCLKLTTRVNEPSFVDYANHRGYTVERKNIECTRYVAYRLKKVSR